MRALRKRKNQIKLIIIFLACVLASASLFLVFNSMGGILDSQLAAERFQGESGLRFAQVTAFFPAGEEVNRDQIFNFQQSLDQSLTEASLEAPEGGSLYVDAFSAQGKVTVTGERGSASVTVLGVGGDFFQFHPLYLRSGSYISSDDIMQDRVILDEELAWQLFGGVDLAGMQVTINGTPYVIAGVVSREDDFASRRAYTAGPGMFMSYDALNAISETLINCYELVCVDPVSGFALDTLQTGFASAVTVENSSRFSMEPIFKIIGDFGSRSMRDKAVAFPYWENAVRLIEDRLAIVLLFAVIFSVFPAVTVVTAVVLLLRYWLRRFKKWLPDYIERRREQRYRQRQEAEASSEER